MISLIQQERQVNLGSFLLSAPEMPWEESKLCEENRGLDGSEQLGWYWGGSGQTWKIIARQMAHVPPKCKMVQLSLEHALNIEHCEKTVMILALV